MFTQWTRTLSFVVASFLFGEAFEFSLAHKPMASKHSSQDSGDKKKDNPHGGRDRRSSIPRFLPLAVYRATRLPMTIKKKRPLYH